jgi:hypothetical protein
LIFTLPYIYGGCVVIFSSGDIHRDSKQRQVDTNIGFIGISSQAAIKSTNAENLVSSAFIGGATDVQPIRSLLNRSVISTQASTFRPLKFSQLIIGSLRKVELDQFDVVHSQSDVMTKNGKFTGDCGGSFSYTLEFDNESQRLNGDILFEDYCDDGILISGQTDVDGYFDMLTGDFIAANLLFDNLGDEYFTFEGEISIDFSDVPIKVILAAYSTDNQTGNVCWLDEYNIALTERIGRIEFSIFGTFYHPEYGFVVLTTSDPFIVHEGDDWPSSGQLNILGENATTAQLTAIDHLHTGIAADTDGDGLLDWESGLLNWSEL